MIGDVGAFAYRSSDQTGRSGCVPKPRTRDKLSLRDNFSH